MSEPLLFWMLNGTVAAVVVAAASRMAGLAVWTSPRPRAANAASAGADRTAADPASIFRRDSGMAGSLSPG